MTLKDNLNNDLKEAMKSGDVVRREAVRALKNAIRNVEIDSVRELSDPEALEVIVKQAKQRRDSIEQYQSAGRTDLVEHEQQELAIIETYLPKQLTDAEIADRVQAVVSELGLSGPKAMGPVMQRLTAELKGLADGKRVSMIVKEVLNRPV